MQAGPVYWAHNFEVPNSFVGVPGPAPARRALLAWDALITADAVSPQMQSVLTATFNWLLNNKANAKVVVLPNMAAAQYFTDFLMAAGHTVSDFDTSVAVTNFDLAVFAPGGDADKNLSLADQSPGTRHAAGNRVVDRPGASYSPAGGTVAVAWQAAAAGFVLESSSTLGPTATWTVVSGAPNPIPGAGSFNVSTAWNKFYRLRK